MNLAEAKESQKKVITHLDQPIMVAAGAGSGKTYTLTQRVTYAFLPGSGAEGAPYLSSLDEVLITTFTNKAAAELKSRIKSSFIKEGLVEQALQVDDAWISTLHGVCARILRENAFALGIDPVFDIASEEQVSTLWAQAFEIALVESTSKENTDMAVFLREQGANTQSGILSKAQQVITKVLALEDGFEAVAVPQISFDPESIIKRMIGLGNIFVAAAQDWSSPASTDLKYLAEMQEALEQARDYLQQPNAFNPFDEQRFLEVFYAFPKTSPKFRSSKEDAEVFEAYRKGFAALIQEVDVGLGLRNIKLLVEFARRAYEIYEELKGPLLLDNTALIRKAVSALRNHPDIVERYRRQFNLIMIDEFQDTDQLQVALLELLAKEDGSDICTVGDAQQSIYKFRGADVSVFNDFKKQICARYANALLPELTDNFRSHRDVLSFVEYIFSSPSFFGKAFLRLNAEGKVNNEPDCAFEQIPRINVAWVHACKNASIDDARILAAQRVAQHFSKLRDDYDVPPSDMVLLLGSMQQADKYARALREAGFESAITGGSVFVQAPEVLLVSDLLNLCQNPYDSKSLYNVLASEVCALSDSSLLELATKKSSTIYKRFDIATAFLQGKLAENHELRPDELTSYAQIDQALRALFKNVGQRGIAPSLRQFFFDISYWYRLEHEGAKGLAIAGNIYKALDIISEFENQGLGVSAVYTAFTQHLESAKLAPRVLATSSSQFIRIMTIHASKGLEFPHVAVSEFSDGTSKAGAFEVENIEGKTCIKFYPTLTKAQKDKADELRKNLELPEEPSASAAPETFFERITQAHKRSELEEAKRVLYVALTRASKSVLLCCAVKGNKEFDYANKGILGALKERFNLSLSEQVSQQTEDIDYGGSAPLKLQLEVLREPLVEACSQTDEDVPLESRTEQAGLEEQQLTPKQHARESEWLDSSGESPVIGSYPVCIQPDASDVLATGWAPSDVRVVSYSALAPYAASQKRPAADFLLSDSPEMALAFGTLFHKVSEKFLLQALQIKQADAHLSVDALIAKARGAVSEYLDAHNEQILLTSELKDRLMRAFDAWIASDECQRLLSCSLFDAEVPFMVKLAVDNTPFYLEGEIDALGIPADGEAFFVDYKTGGSLEETPEELHDKHLLQAQCYAYALLRQGYHVVTGVFVRVDCLVESLSRDISCALSPTAKVQYSFSQSDVDDLECSIRKAYQAFIAKG